jgi:hypothetical protein
MYSDTGILNMLKYAMADDCIRGDFLLNEIKEMTKDKIKEHKETIIATKQFLPNQYH